MNKDLEYIMGVSYTPNKELQEIAGLASGCLWSPGHTEEALQSFELTEKTDLHSVATNYAGNLWVDEISGHQETSRERYDENYQPYLWKFKKDKEYKEKVDKLLSQCNVDYKVWKQYVFDSEWEKGRKYYDEIFKAKPRKMLVEKIKKVESPLKWGGMNMNNWQRQNIEWENRQANFGVNLGGFELRVVDGVVVRENANGERAYLNEV